MKTISKLTIIALVLIALASCGKNNGNHDASGNFEATEVIVSSQANGQIMALNIIEGQTVEMNKPVGYIDTIQLHLKRIQLQASLKAIDSRFYDVSKQIAATNQQITKQKTELQRFENLLQSNAATQKQVDDINAQIIILQKQLAAQTETLENNNRSVSGESAALVAQIKQIEDLISKSVISSPISGTVLSKYAEQGEITMQGKALFKVADINNMFLRAYITSDQIAQIKLGQEVSVFVDSGDKKMKEYSGTIAWISDKAEFTPKTIQTRNERANQVYAVKIAVKNDGFLKIGMYGEVRF
jgi:HlyD family secretion protein